MSCAQCGQPTPRARICKKCGLLEQLEESTGETIEPTPRCIECDEQDPNGDYHPDRPGVWMCRDHHPEIEVVTA